jgi:glycosyltransferase involved in cell wall biosynthesis
MRILMINYEFPPIGGGTGMACSQLLGELADRSDVDIDLVTSGTAPQPRVEHFASNIRVHRLPVTKRDLFYWRAGELFQWTRQAIGYARKLSAGQTYDVCHCWAGWPSGIVGYAIRKRLPYLVSLRGSDVPGYSRRLRLLDPLLMRHVARQVWEHAARVVAVSRNLRDLALQTRPNALIDVIPNGVDIHRFTPPAIVGDERRILFVGRLVERKGVHILVQAFQGVLAAIPDATLVIVGDGPERSRLETMADELGIRKRIVFRGHVDGADMPSAYREGVVMVLPALADAMPNVVLEAMASGLAIVTTPTGGSEIVRGNGVIVPFGDPDALRQALVGYLTDTERLRAHRQESRRLAEGMSWAAVADFKLQLYREVVEMRTRKLAHAPREFQLRPKRAERQVRHQLVAQAGRSIRPSA